MIQEQGQDISKMSVVELKALAYEKTIIIGQAQMDLQTITQRIGAITNQLQNPVPEPEKKNA